MISQLYKYEYTEYTSMTVVVIIHSALLVTEVDYFTALPTSLTSCLPVVPCSIWACGVRQVVEKMWKMANSILAVRPTLRRRSNELQAYVTTEPVRKHLRGGWRL